jgi:hypothetical protein
MGKYGERSAIDNNNRFLLNLKNAVYMEQRVNGKTRC